MYHSVLDPYYLINIILSYYINLNILDFDSMIHTEENIKANVGFETHRNSLQKKVCDYSLDESLQDGYSGKVFKGLYHDPNQRKVHPVPVVIKCCKKFSSWNTETSALQNLDHPNIIKLIGKPQSNVPATDYTSSIESSNNIENNPPPNRHLTPGSSPQRTLPLIHVLAQELASNGDLYELLKSHGHFNETIVRTIIKPVVQGLLYAYETSGISHRDIKLENIFIHEDGTIKIGDWGLSGFDTKDRYCISSCGTLGYMSPEMVCREAYDANKTDVWAIAVVLFSLCTGVRPYAEPKSRRKNPNDFSWRDDWLGAMMSGKWKLWWMSHARTTPLVKNMSDGLRDLFEKMFHAKPDERASLHDVLNHRWMNGDICSNAYIISLCKKKNTKLDKLPQYGNELYSNALCDTTNLKKKYNPYSK
jgi:serine/threonine protein kinase